MPFLDILKNLVDPVEGARAATIMGVDGISVQKYPVEDSPCDMESVGVEYGGAIEEIKKASKLLGLGKLEEVVVSTHGPSVILRMVTAEYFIVLVVEGDSNIGRARYHLGRAVAKAREEL